MAQEQPGSIDVGGVYVVSVEPVECPEPVAVYDIEVEEDHSFLVAGVVAHNSGVCRARDGKVYPLDKGPRPPAHWNCRSVVVPVLKTWREMGIDADEADAGTRSSMNGQVPASETYDSWLRKQPVEFQNEVLGATKAKLFRAGLTMDRFVNRAGDELTLEELRRKEADIFKKAGV